MSDPGADTAPDAVRADRIAQLRDELLGDLCSMAELGAATGYSERGIYSLCAQGLPFVLVRGQRFFEPQRVREFLLKRNTSDEPQRRKPGRPRRPT
jgi:hypothetical protein